MGGPWTQASGPRREDPGEWTQESGPRRAVPGERSQVPTADVLRDLQKLKGKRVRGGGQICNQGQRAPLSQR